MALFHVHYDHIDPRGSSTSGFKPINASNKDEAREKFEQQHRNSGSYTFKVTRVEQVS